MLDLCLETPPELIGKEQDPSFAFEELMKLLSFDEGNFFQYRSCIARSFVFPYENRIVLDKSPEIAFKWSEETVLRLPIPDKAEVSFSDCLSQFLQLKDIEHPAFKNLNARCMTTLAQFPQYLAISLARLDKSGNLVNSTPVDVPESIDIGLLRSDGGIKDSEEYWYDCPDVPSLNSVEDALKFGSPEYVDHYRIGKRMLLSTADPMVVQSLCSAGFEEEDARKGYVILHQQLEKERGDAECIVDTKDVMLWLIKHRETIGQYFSDNCGEEEGQKKKTGGVDVNNMSDIGKQMVGLGFNPKHVKRALLIHPSNMDRAVDYILNNMDQLLLEDEKEAEEERKRIEREREELKKKMQDRKARMRSPRYPPNSDPSSYTVFAVINHVTTENSLNHFVLHVRVNDPETSTDKWILCDGARFSLAPKPPMDTGCFFIYRKVAK